MGRCRNCLPGRGHQQYIGVVGCHIKLVVGELEQNGRAATTTCSTLGGNKTGGRTREPPPAALPPWRAVPCVPVPCAGAGVQLSAASSSANSAAPSLFFLFSRDHVTVEVESG